MDTQTAAKILEHFNLWRRDDNIPNQYEMPNPFDIGIAIDLAVEVLKQKKTENHNDLCGLAQYEACHDTK